MRFIAGLMPREARFFELFNAHADLVQQGGAAIVALLGHYQSELERSKQNDRIHDLEHRADRITHDTVGLLRTVLVTPFDRDDIHRLISRMDDILDLIQDTGESLVLYDISSVTPEASQLAECLKQCCDRVATAIRGLNDMKNSPLILKTCAEIDGLESDADRVMRGAVSSLFRNEQDTRQLIKLKAVYELLEAATDKCQDVANVIESIVLENS
jgi:predicted phosphate transport protein (TIGR00153 family)